MTDVHLFFRVGVHSRCFFETRVQGLQFATTLPASPSVPQAPLVLVKYSLSQLSFLAPFFEAMKSVGALPTVYLWQEKDTAELFIYFELKRPTVKLVEAVAGGKHSALLARIPQWESLATGAYASMDSASASHFLTLLRTVNGVGVVIVEDEPELLVPETAHYPQPLHLFSVTEVQRHPPPPMLLY